MNSTGNGGDAAATAAAVGGGIGVLLFLLIMLAFMVLMIASVWKVFAKAGQPGWAAIVPIFNTYIMIKIAGKPGWWLLLCFIPIVNIVIGLIVLINLAQNFGKGIGFVLGLIFLGFIFWPILGFGDSTYSGPATPMT